MTQKLDKVSDRSEVMASILRFPVESGAAGSGGGYGHDELLRLRAAVDASSDAIFVIDVETVRFVDVNDTATSRLGYARAELLELGPADISPHSRAEIQARYRALIAAGAHWDVRETELIRKDGTRVPVQISRNPLQT